MKRLLLHIGTEKTATGSIQSFLADNRPQLLKHGWTVPTSLGAPDQRRLAVLCNDPEFVDAYVEWQGWSSPKERSIACNAWRDAFQRELGATAVPNMVISSEHLSSRLFTDTEMERLRGFLTPLFDEIDVLIYLRDPLEAAISLLSTAVKSGETSGVLPAPPTDWGTGNERSWISVCDHRQTLERWEKFFPGRIHVRLFEPTFLRGGSIIADFSEHLDISDLTDFQHPARTNESLSATGVQLLGALNRRFQSSDGTMSPADQRAITRKVVASMSGYDKTLPTSEQAAAYKAAFASSCEWVRSRYFPERPVLFAETHSKTTESCSKPASRDIEAIADLLVTEMGTNHRSGQHDSGILSRLGIRIRKMFSKQS